MDNKEEFEEKIASVMRDSVDDLAKTAGILATWMAEQKYTIAEQLAILELVRSTILAGFMTSMVRNEIEKARAAPKRSAATDIFNASLS